MSVPQLHIDGDHYFPKIKEYTCPDEQRSHGAYILKEVNLSFARGRHTQVATQIESVAT